MMLPISNMTTNRTTEVIPSLHVVPWKLGGQTQAALRAVKLLKQVPPLMQGLFNEQ